MVKFCSSSLSLFPFFFPKPFTEFCPRWGKNYLANPAHDIKCIMPHDIPGRLQETSSWTPEGTRLCRYPPTGPPQGRRWWRRRGPPVSGPTGSSWPLFWHSSGARSVMKMQEILNLAIVSETCSCKIVVAILNSSWIPEEPFICQLVFHGRSMKRLYHWI